VANLFLNSGHGTLGWTMSAGSGRVLADIVSGTATEIESADLGYARYLRNAPALRRAPAMRPAIG
jgi:D-amino-acid dehydrogenase